jgi:rhamnogalacturonyl hydrolase YesR
MADSTIEQAFNELLAWCRARDFAGYDPFDALNSRLFQSTSFKNSSAARLLWTQALKRSPVDLRSLALVPPQKNAKGLALFALAALANYRRLKTSETQTGAAETAKPPTVAAETATAETEARDLLDQLWRTRIQGYGGAAWGYNFAWQSRNFYAPLGTPMIVPTAFAARAYVEAYQALGDDKYLKTARSSCDFVINDLKRTLESDEEICFSYSPLDDTQIFNASLLAAETLASVAALTQEPGFCDFATRAARYAIRRQRDDGSWGYGAAAGQQWTDNFHTAYVLLSLSRIMKSSCAGEIDLSSPLQRGYEFWRERFFLADGWPKYYHDSLYPADAHAAATAIITLLEFQEIDRGARALAEKIAAWTIKNLRDGSGFFYYQRRRFHTVRTPFMRWTQGWMLYALARLLEEK